MKTCNKCGTEKPLKDFYVANKPRGPYVLPRCISCMDDQRRERMASSDPMYLLRQENKRNLKDARDRGEKYYAPALPCKYGHMAKRLVSTQQCTECLRARRRAQRGGEISTSKRNSFKRQVARNLGKVRFKGVTECPNGHNGERLVSTGQCCECLSARPAGKASEEAIKRAKVKQNAKRRSRVGRAKQRKYQSEVLYGREEYRLSRFMYASIRRVIAGKDRHRDKRTREELGYWVDELKARIETNFKPGMSWDNYGEWHIDHTIPISHFIKKGETRPSIINALCNLKPMWARDNLSKGSDRHWQSEAA